MESSRSSPSPDGLRPIVERSLRILSREQPAAYERLARALPAGGAWIEVEGAPFGVGGGAEGRGVEILDTKSGCSVVLRSTPRALVSLLDGEVSLIEAIERDDVDLSGPVDELARFDDALFVYLAGAVRAPSFPSLLAALWALAGRA